MNKDNLASIITRLHFCNNESLENIDDWKKMKKVLMELDDNQFLQKLDEFGFLDKEAS